MIWSEQGERISMYGETSTRDRWPNRPRREAIDGQVGRRGHKCMVNKREEGFARSGVRTLCAVGDERHGWEDQ